MEELKPCPACGALVNITGGDGWHNQHEFWICCENEECGCVRVGDTEREECIRRWNDIPRRMNWTKEPPKVPGFYWITGDPITVVEVCKNSNGELVVFYPGSEIEDDIAYLGDCEWAGPIPEPHWEEYD